MVNWTMIIIIFVLVFVLLAVIGVWLFIKIVYKHKVRIVDLGKQSIELDFKARDHVKDGVRYWQLDKEKNKELKLMPIPPADAINISKGGKKSVMAWRTETGEYIWGNRLELFDQKALDEELNKTPKEIISVTDDKEREKLIALYKETVLKRWEAEGRMVKAYQPFSSKQRMIIMNNFIKAQSRTKKNLMEQLPVIVSVGALVLLVVALMIFWGDIAKPVLDARQMGLEEKAINKETLEIIQDIQRGQQRIEGEQKQIIDKIDGG